MSELTDEQVRAELERLGLDVEYYHNCESNCDDCKAFYLLAKSLVELRELRIEYSKLMDKYCKEVE